MNELILHYSKCHSESLAVADDLFLPESRCCHRNLQNLIKSAERRLENGSEILRRTLNEREEFEYSIGVKRHAESEHNCICATLYETQQEMINFER